jgi:type IV secretory pathway component VirB8
MSTLNNNKKEGLLVKLKNRYRLVILNEETFEEVTSFKLSRLSVYVALSTLFVVLVAITAAIVMFTPLKYYIPGYGDLKQRQEFIQLNMKVDSLQTVMKDREQYWQNVQQVLLGDFNPDKLDTTSLKLPPVINSTN